MDGALRYSGRPSRKLYRQHLVTQLPSGRRHSRFRHRRPTNACPSGDATETRPAAKSASISPTSSTSSRRPDERSRTRTRSPTSMRPFRRGSTTRAARSRPSSTAMRRSSRACSSRVKVSSVLGQVPRARSRSPQTVGHEATSVALQPLKLCGQPLEPVSRDHCFLHSFAPSNREIDHAQTRPSNRQSRSGRDTIFRLASPRWRSDRLPARPPGEPSLQPRPQRSRISANRRAS